MRRYISLHFKGAIVKEIKNLVLVLFNYNILVDLFGLFINSFLC